MENGKRTKKITARFTEDEYKTILALEQALGISKTDLTRTRLLQNTRAVLINAKETISRLDAIGAELGRSGNNINQLAKYANVLKKQGILSAAIMERFNILFEAYNKQQKELVTAIRQLIRQMGK